MGYCNTGKKSKGSESLEMAKKSKGFLVFWVEGLMCIDDGEHSFDLLAQAGV